MINIFKYLDDNNGNVDANFREEMLQNITESKEQILEKINALNIHFNNDDLVALYVLFQQFAEDNELVSFLLETLYSFYIENIDFLIAESPHAINLLLDIFCHNTQVFDNIQLKKVFVEKTYPLLTTATKIDEGSDRDVAIDMYLTLLQSPELFSNGESILRKFVSENPQNPFVSDAKERITEMR